MRDLKKPERSAIEAVAKRFSATWEQGSDPPDVWLIVGGKRIAVDIKTPKRRSTGQSSAAEPRLRFDKVVTGLTERLKSSLGETIPRDRTVLLAITAPIRLPSKTVAAIEGAIQSLVRRSSWGRDKKETIHGNRVHMRVFRDASGRAPRVIAFVHNPDLQADLFFNTTQELLELTDAGAAAKPGIRWLVVISPRRIAALEAYRYIYSQLRAARGFQRVVMVFGDGRIGVLAE